MNIAKTADFPVSIKVGIINMDQCVLKVQCTILIHSFLIIFRVPDTAKVTEKMVYASTKEALKSKFDGIKFRVQASDITDADDKVLMERAKKA